MRPISTAASTAVLPSLLILLPGSALLADDAPVLAPVAEVMKSYVDRGEIAGAATLVIDHGKVAHRHTVGFSDLQSKRPVEANDLFWIASVTKPMTAAGIMMLVDDGKIALSDPIDKYLPEFKDLWMIAEKTDEQITLHKPKTKVTIRHLLTHTSGLADLGAPHEGTPLAEYVAGYSRLPLQFEPGTQWKYGNAGMNTLGRIIEVVSGQSYEAFLKARLFDPLKMNETTFYPTEAQLPRVAKSYRLNPDTKELQETKSGFLNGQVTSTRRTVMPAAGLYSTAADVARFLQMLLNHGELDGQRVLSEQAVRDMTQTQTGELVTGFTDGMSFGLGVGVVKTPQKQTAMLSAGTFGHGGAYGNAAWADPARQILYIMMIQRSNLTPHGDGCELRREFQQAAASAIPTPP